MPIYEFFCENCNLKFEKIYYKISEDKKETCPKCSGSSGKVPSVFGFKFNESKHIPKEIDLKVGKESEKRWLDYEEKKSVKEKIRKENNTTKLSRDMNGNYSPLDIKCGDTKLSENEAVSYRKQMYQDFTKIKNDPDTKKFTPED